MLEEVKMKYDNNYKISIFTDEQWIETLEKFPTLYQFIENFCQNLSVDDRKVLQKKYSEYLNAEQMNEGGTVKRILVSYYDKIINASLRSFILSDRNSIDIELLNMYRSSNPLTVTDVDRYLSMDPDLFMNKFVYKNMDIDKLTQLVYDRFTQYKPDNYKSKKLITGTEDSKIDNELKEVIKDTLQDMNKKMKDVIALSSSTSVHLPTYIDISNGITNRIHTTTASGRVSVQPQFFSPTQPTTDALTLNKKRKRSGIITKTMPSISNATQFDFISPNKISKIEKVKMEKKVYVMN